MRASTLQNGDQIYVQNANSTPHISQLLSRPPPILPQYTVPPPGQFFTPQICPRNQDQQNHQDIPPGLLHWQLQQERRMQEQMEQWKRENKEQRDQMIAFQQKTVEDFKGLLISAVGKDKNDDGKKTKCPKWDTDEQLPSFCDRLKIWDRITNHMGKYLDLLESLQRLEGKLRNRR